MAATTTTRTQDSIGWERLAGAGGIAFAVLVAGSNIAVPNPPAWDASGSELSTFVHDHHTALALTVATFAITAPALVAFVAGFVGRIFRSERNEARLPAVIGAGGALLICVLFSTVVVSRLVLLALDGSANGSAPLMELAWHLEAAAFVLNMVAIGIAVFGFGIAGATAGLLPTWFRGGGIPGLAAGILAALQASAVVNGANGWQIGFVAFLGWLALLLVAGTRMVRDPRG